MFKDVSGAEWVAICYGLLCTAVMVWIGFYTWNNYNRPLVPVFISEEQ
jgi:hypothetical protein